MTAVSDIRARWRGLQERQHGPSRLVSLDGAVRAHVKAGDLIYFGGSMARPNAAMFEVARTFWGTNPRFTLAAPAIANQHAPLIRAGLVAKVVSSIHAMTFPTPAPHPLYVDAARKGSVTFENWSLLTLIQRLQAAAFGLPFMVTGSLAGSDMEADLAAKGVAASVPDPFGSGRNVSCVAPLAPDVTFVHALAADAQGNAIISPPLYDDKWAAFAARRVVVTADRIVDSAFVRRHAHLVQIPASRVDAVCEVPFGGHPNSLPGDAVPELQGYPDDYDFLTDLREAGKTPEGLDAWSREWILGCRNHEDYLAKLGATRLHALRGRTDPTGWEAELPELRSGPATDAERNVVLAARVIAGKLDRGARDCILAGLGISSLAAWCAAIRCQERGVVVPLMVEAGMFGYLPSPGDPFLFNYRNMFSGSMLTDAITTLGVMTAGAGNRAIGVLGAAQVDRDGNINTSRLPNLLLTGSGGANDIASGASEVLVTMALGTKRLVEKVDFVTSPGRAVEAIVTPRGVLERRDGAFRITRVLPAGGQTAQETLALIQANCGWEIGPADTLEVEPEPDDAELGLVRLLDPNRLFSG